MWSRSSSNRQLRGYQRCRAVDNRHDADSHQKRCDPWRHGVLYRTAAAVSERQQCQHTHAACQRLGYLLLEDKVPRAGEDVLAWSANSVGFDLDNVKEFRRKLSLIDDQWCRMGSDKPKGGSEFAAARSPCYSISLSYANRLVFFMLINQFGQ